MGTTRSLNKRIIGIIVLLLAFTLLGIACKKKEKTSSTKQKATDSFPMTVTDDSGRKVKIETKPKRIISLAPSNTEILFALDLDEEIVGVTTYCDYPEAAKNKEKIGSFAQPNIEKVIAQKSDLVLATGDLQDPVVKELEKLKIAVFICNPESLNQLFNTIKTIGGITGKTAEAKALTDTMKGVTDNVTEKVAKLDESEKPKVFFELYNEPLTTIGKDTFHNELIETAGGKNITGDIAEKYPQYSLDTLIVENPDVYLAISDSMYNPGDIKERPPYANMAAIQNDRVAVINGDLVNRPGPRLTDGLWEIAKAIHPDLFK